MQISALNQTNNLCNTYPNFGHSHSAIKNNSYKPKEKAIIAGTSILGVLGALAVLAKGAKYSLSPAKMFKNVKDSYVFKADYEWKEIITLGAGSCLGGLAGGFIVDKNKQNRKAKVRESIMQIGNVSIPILTVDLMVNRIFKNKSEGIKALAGLGGVGIGVFLANIIMNGLNRIIFKEKDNKSSRGIQLTDFSAHLDDVVAAAHYIAPKSKLVHAIGRIVPAVLVIPGLEVGNKTAD
jgi:hypothetical protein